MEIELSKVKVDPQDLVPTLNFMGESYYDEEMLQKVEQVKELAFECISSLYGLRSAAKDKNEYSIVKLYKAADDTLKDIVEYIGE